MTRRGTILLALSTTALGGMPVWLVSAYAPQIVATYSLQATTYGTLLGAFFLFSALTAVPVGLYVQRIDWLSGVVWTALFSILGLLFLAFLADGLVLLVLGLFIASWANSFSQTSANKGLAAQVPQELQGRAFGFKQAALPISTLIVALTVPFFSAGDDWRYAFCLMALISLGIGYVAVRSLKSQGFESVLPFRPRTPVEKVDKKTSRARAPRYLLFLAAGAGIATGATMSFVGFLVLFSVHIGFSPIDAALALTIGSCAGIVARISLGFVADRLGSGHIRLVQMLMLGGAAGFGFLSIADTIFLLAVGTFFGFALGWAWNGVFHFVVMRSRPDSSAFFTGVVQAAMMAGATLGPPIFGLLAEVSYFASWVFLSCAMIVSVLFIERGYRLMPRAGNQ
jgi:predicted MFS family arabinose efflux permease